ncbi:MAG: AMP-binding protein [Lentisphaeria bacterium]|nr:AMP-binding protein [Lentisphaeria bacterium]
MPESSSARNIAHYLPRLARECPHRRAIVVPCGRDSRGRCAYVHWTFAQLNAASDRYAWGLDGLGLGRGVPVLLMVRPGLDFFGLTFALFKAGAVPVLIDPGMGWRSFLRCVRQTRPEAFIGIPVAHVLRRLCPAAFAGVRVAITLGSRFPAGGTPLAALPAREESFPEAAVLSSDVAAVLFTTGSTGPAKGVLYTHGIFCEQVEILRRAYAIGPEDIDLPCFPLFGLFSVALGATAVIPDMDPSRPARVRPERIIEAVRDHGVTYSFGSPTLWARVGRHCAAAAVRLPSLRRVIMAGAPVPGHVHATLLEHVLPPGAQTFTPYGATEALPLCNFTGREMLDATDAATRNGAGMCVGRPLPGIQLRIVRISDDPIATWDDGLLAPQGRIGEIVAGGPVVTAAYHNLPEATRYAKITSPQGTLHRMGDLGYLDSDGRLWFCGRKAHRVETAQGTLYSVCCEAIANGTPGVARSALVGVGADRSAQRPVLVVEPEPGAFPRGQRQATRFRERILAVLQAHDITRPIREILFHRSFPVDIRHNAKIRREVLARWAARKLQRRRF